MAAGGDGDDYMEQVTKKNEERSRELEQRRGATATDAQQRAYNTDTEEDSPEEVVTSGSGSYNPTGEEVRL